MAASPTEYRVDGSVQRVLRSERWAVGHFALGPQRAAWQRHNQIGAEPLIVFPSRAVEIAQSGHRAVVANPNVAMFYDARVPYRRQLIDPRGDDCTFFSLCHDVWRELVTEHDPGSTDAALFRFPRGPVRPELRLRHHLLLGAIERGEADELLVEETLIALAGELVSDAALHADGARIRRPIERQHRDAVHAMETFLSQRFCEPLALDDIASSADLSPFHAARLFRRFTGTTLHGYREQLRLREALRRIGAGCRLDALALELGFAHHSHLTDRFRRTFGAPPSALRATGATSPRSRPAWP